MYRETKALSTRGFDRFRVRTPEDLREVCQRAADAGLCAIDTETYSTDPSDPDGALDPHKNAIRLVQIAIPGDPPTAYLISVPQVKDLSALRKLLLDPAVMKVGQNLQFENQVFMKHLDAYVENGLDTMIASRMFQPFAKKIQAKDEEGNPVGKPYWPSAYDATAFKHNLGAITKRYLDIDLDKDMQLSDWSREKLTTEQLHYAYSDVEILLPLYQKLEAALIAAGNRLAAQIEFDAVPAIAQMRTVGWKVDMALLAEIQEAAIAKREAVRKTLTGYFPARQLSLFEEEPINLDSPAQVKNALRDKFGVQLDSRSKSDLLMLKATGPREAGPVVDALVNYGSLRNIKDTAGELMREYHLKTGRLHADIFQIGQHQHRVAVRHPNWQKVPRADSFGHKAKGIFNYPRNFREAFIPEDGFMFAIADYGGNQMRIMAELAGVSKMIEAFALGRDVHRTTAAEMLGKQYEDIGEKSVERQNAKTWGFALLFGAMYNRFQMQLLEDTGRLYPMTKIRQLRDGFFRVYFELLDYYGLKRFEVATEHKITTGSGRIIPFVPGVEYWNEPVNFPVSATEVDGSKLALGRMFRKLWNDYHSSHLVGYVYDELIVETPEHQAEEMAELLASTMQAAMQEQLQVVPAVAEGKAVSSWAGK